MGFREPLCMGSFVFLPSQCLLPTGNGSHVLPSGLNGTNFLSQEGDHFSSQLQNDNTDIFTKRAWRNGFYLNK